MSNLNQYINQQDWILDHIHPLNLKPLELTVLLLIEKSNRLHESIDPQKIVALSMLSSSEVDKAITALIHKTLIKLEMTQNSILYHVTLPLHESFTDLSEHGSLIQLIEKEFKRPLVAHELDKLNDWLIRLSADFVIHALREAIIYQKLSFAYMDKILLNWLSEGITLDQLNKGLRK